MEHESYVEFRNGQNAVRLPYFYLFMVLHRVSAIVVHLVIYPVLLLVPTRPVGTTFILYSVFYFIFLCLASYATKKIKPALTASPSLLKYSYVMAVAILIIDDFVMTEFFMGIFNPIRILGGAILIALLPLFDKKMTNILLAAYLVANMAFKIILGNPPYIFWIGSFYAAILTMIAVVASFFVKRNHLRRFLEEKRIADQNDMLMQVSTTDALTKISNRHAFDEYLERIWEEARKENKAISIMMMDVDRFKRYNDNFGHIEGDKCLVRIAEEISRKFQRQGDMFARYGGEEFVAVMIGDPNDDVLIFAETIRESIEDLKIPNPLNTQNPYITLSIGLVSRVPTEDDNPYAVVELADAALYAAKQTGRNKVVADKEAAVIMNAHEISALTLEGATSYSFNYDFEKDAVFFNDNFLRDFGLGAENRCITGASQSMMEFIPSKNDQKLLLDSIKQVNNKETDRADFKVQVYNIRTKGVHLLAVRAKCAWDATGKPLMLAGAISDVTQQARDEELSNLIIEGGSDCIFVYDIEENVLEFSAKIFDLIHIESKRLENAKEAWPGYIIPEDRHVFVSALEQVLNRHTDAFKVEYRLSGKGSEPFWVAHSGKCSYGTKGSPAFIAGSLINLGAMRQFSAYLDEMRYVDKLSGLPDRIAFNRDFAVPRPTEANQANRYIIMVDIDDFANINSLHGLAAGDKLLMEYAALLAFLMPQAAVLYHFESDCFVLHCEAPSRTDIERLCNQIRIRSANGLMVDDVYVKTTVSIGVAEFSAVNNVDDVVINAELALRKAKSRKNRVVFFMSEDRAAYIARLNLEAELGECVSDNFRGFEIYYQPLFSTSLNMIVGAEALLRWRNRNNAIMLPETIIPALQNLGVFEETESWVFKTAAKKCAEWIKLTGFDELAVSINMSPGRAVKDDIVEEVLAVIKEVGLSTKNIVLELTEEALVMESKADDIFKRAREAGLRLAIDDFGTGYSSLGYLRDLHVSELKIDRSFVGDIETNETNKKFVGTIITLAHIMNYNVCVEGVETREQARTLTDLNADLLQGRYFSPPVPEDVFREKFLTEICGGMS